MTPPVPRTWTVELRPQQHGPLLICPQCTPTTSPRGTTARSAALAHLAHHARGAPLPHHLRTCQCHERGCRWHPRHRGCAGPVLLVLIRESGGRIWRLTDACAACAGATTDAAVVPDTVLARAARPATTSEPGRTRTRRPRGPSAQVRVREMLSYLAVALPPETSAAARLVAVQCALRATASAHVRIPAGLLRGMRLDSHNTPLQELADAHWLYSATAEPSGCHQQGFSAQILDATVRTQAPARRDRARAADWALRICHANPICLLGVAPRLLALTLASHTPTVSTHGLAETDHLTRMCGLTARELTDSLALLTAARWLQSWTFEPSTEDLRWTLAP
ncbi:hypothetical protein [Streptomyces flavidovirens]